MSPQTFSPFLPEESPSTASTTPDSTDGGNDESDFPELQTAREFSEDEEEEEASVEWGTPRELTFSYITIAAPNSGSPPMGDHGPRGRRDSQTRRGRAPLPRTETCETFVPALGDNTSLGDFPPLDALAPEHEEGAPRGAEHFRPQALTSPLEFGQQPSLDEEMGEAHEEEEEEEEEEGLGWEPIAEHQDEPDLSGSPLGICIAVADLVYWRDTRKSACVFTVLMVALLCLLHFSIISVASYVSLAALTITISLRVYSKALQAIHRGEGNNPFQAQLDAEIGLSKEQLERLTERVVFCVTSGTKSLQRLFLVDDMVESIKFAFFFYILTYVGAVFNGLTLLILGVISAFTFPLLYRQHQAQIDQYVGLVRNQLSNLRAKMLAKLPTAKAKAE
ncbi:hypothetical protein JD844_006055 [Phrynosoma platyrhinos]|uniref:Reticulon n=1 Tax=Phrynosoma platyrhinos TaxID=52577 RepID=A0ABQ7TQB6_PHRPL|nr:hypothetical protein JD844_006055 [Phrynosoma platyrhinos]